MTRSLKFRLAAAFVLFVSLAVGMLSFWMTQFSKTTIEVQAEASAADWVSGFEQTVPDLEAILQGAPARADQYELIQATMVASSVFGVEIFNTEGKLVFDSALPGMSTPPNEELNLRAIGVAQSGVVDLTVELGDTAAGEPEKFVEAYLPFFAGGSQPVGVVELYIDVSGAVAALTKKFGWVSGIAILATMLVLVAPGVAVIKQYDSIKQRDEKLFQMSRVDSLTGLLNRRGREQDLALMPGLLQEGETAWILQIDLDKFKPINDVFGHQVGDELLTELATRLCDAAGPKDLIARTGGDEFFMCMVSRQSVNDLLDHVDSLRRAMSKPVRINGRNCTVGATIGVAHWRGDDDGAIDAVVLKADIALQVGKDMGRNKVVLFEPHMQLELLNDSQIAEDVAEGLAEGRFMAHFQPLFDKAGETVVGFEALARWNHPTKGLLTPSAFLSASEKSGLVSDIDLVVLKDAVAFAHQLKEQGRSDLRISLNIAAVQLKRRDIVDDYMWALDEAGLSPDQFRIEVLETTLLEERASHVIENLMRFHALGFKIDLDDFGTGHTAIASLNRYPVDRIKIDRSLISGIGHDDNMQVLTKLITTLGEQLDLEVLAEGLDNKADLECVQRMSIDALQGFMLAKPMEANACLALLDREPGTKGLLAIAS